ncbi:10681_t:CDS:2, partial [Scutellospora calospora]
NLLQKNETQFLRNLFPPAKVELDKDINGYLDNIFSIFNSKEILNAENIFKEVEQKRKLVNLGIETLKERQITFIFDIVQKFLKKFRKGDFFSLKMSELKFCTEVLESCLDIIADIDGSYTSWDSVSISSKLKLQNSQEPVNRTRPDFTLQNYSNYEIFTLEVARSLTSKILKKIKNDFAKLSKQCEII